MSYLISRLFCSLLSFFCLIFSTLAHADIHDISRIFHSTPTLSSFEICHSGGCADVSSVSISDEEWQQVSLVFVNNAQNGAEERAQIAQAIGVLETLVGNKIGTSGDLAGTFYDGPLTGQQDCNDEAINTTTYMRLLKLKGLIQLHEIEDTRTRNFFFTGWPHSTAAIHDIKTGERFAVDSWFYDNGHAAIIVPFAIWKANYRPDDSPIGKTRLVKPDTNRAVVTQSNQLPLEKASH